MDDVQIPSVSIAEAKEMAAEELIAGYNSRKRSGRKPAIAPLTPAAPIQHFAMRNKSPTKKSVERCNLCQEKGKRHEQHGMVVLQNNPPPNPNRSTSY